MPDAKSFESKAEASCLLLVHDFAHEIVEEWKGWLTGSLPMAGITVISLVNPDWVHLPIWAWVVLIFVAGLLSAMFRVYRELRNQRDAIRQQFGDLGFAGPFILVPFSRHLELSAADLSKTGVK